MLANQITVWLYITAIYIACQKWLACDALKLAVARPCRCKQAQDYEFYGLAMKTTRHKPSTFQETGSFLDGRVESQLTIIELTQALTGNCELRLFHLLAITRRCVSRVLLETQFCN